MHDFSTANLRNSPVSRVALALTSNSWLCISASHPSARKPWAPRAFLPSYCSGFLPAASALGPSRGEPPTMAPASPLLMASTPSSLTTHSIYTLISR